MPLQRSEKVGEIGSEFRLFGHSSFAALSATVRIQVDKSKLARSAAACIADTELVAFRYSKRSRSFSYQQWSFMLLRPFWDQCGHIVAQLVVHARQKSHLDCRLPILNSTEKTAVVFSICRDVRSGAAGLAGTEIAHVAPISTGCSPNSLFRSSSNVRLFLRVRGRALGLSARSQK